MAHYIDGFILPIPRDGLETYQTVVKQVAKIWKEHGALDYTENVGDDFSLEGVGSFFKAVKAAEDEVIIFGWVTFESRQARDLVNKKVAADPRMADLIKPLVNTKRRIFDAERMLYAGFQPLF
ncbi:DUF1428 domain-containing protein [Kangiella sp. TOML190]|uniref:DUF1428 domain-containing protein n=1 Tax=Kangiella sp. TOML190 TaxID=2931351 RepID=UPI002041F516|nr:DUF1428 domain-containing protein [Kangiella sp. TOML190]